MGVGLRRMTEKMRQATGFTGKNFQPTSNVRCDTMMKEASDFADHLKKCEHAIVDMKTAAESILTTTKATMSAPLPRVYEDTAAGSGGGVQPVISIGGPSFQVETVARLSQTCSAQLESQVLVPIKRWLEVFGALHHRLKEVESLRLEVDSRRHTVINLAAEVDHLRAKLSKVNGSDGKLEGNLDDAIKKLQHKEGKLSLTVQNFQEKEKSLAEDLSTLIKDAAWLRHYMALALRFQGEALLGASSALGEVSEEAEPAVNMAALSVGGTTSHRDGAERAHTTSRQSTISESTDTSGGPAAGSGSGTATAGRSSASDAPPTGAGNQYASTGSPSNPFLSSGVLK